MATLIRLFIVLLASLYIAGCATNPVTGRPDLVFTSEEKEVEIGKQAHQQIIGQQYRLYDDPKLQEYVTGLVNELAAVSHRSELEFHSFVLDSPQVNAFALPGGYVYVTRGIMAYMNSEAELAGVLGHEIGHVTARHGVRQQSAATVTGVLAAAAAIATGTREIGQAANFAGTALVRGYGRSHELEADRLGAEYLAKTGYDPEEMINVVAILKNQEEFDKQLARQEGREPRAYHGVFSTHPANDQRLQEVIRAADKFRSSDNVRDPNGRFIELSNGMTYGSGEADGIVRGNKFYHKDLDLALSFPSGWKIDNLPDRLIASAPQQSAVMLVTLGQAESSETPKQFTERTFGNVQNGQNLTAGSYEGYSGIVRANTPFGEQNTRVSVIFRGNQAFQFMSATREANDLAKYDQDFIATATGMRELRRNERHLAEAQKIKLITAKRGDTFETLAANSPLEQNAADQLRLINGMYPDGQPTVGQRIKIVE